MPQPPLGQLKVRALPHQLLHPITTFTVKQGPAICETPAGFARQVGRKSRTAAS